MSYEQFSQRGRSRRVGYGMGRRRKANTERLPPLPVPSTSNNNQGGGAAGFQGISPESLCHYLITDTIHTFIVDARPKDWRGTTTVRLAWSPPIWEPLGTPHEASGQLPTKPSDALINYARKAIMLLCAGAEDYLHPAHKLNSKRIIFVDDHGHEYGPAKTMATVFSELKTIWKDGIFASTSSINASNVPKDVLFLRGGIQGLFSKFQSLCFGTDGRPLVPGGVMRRGSSSEMLSESDGDSEQEKPWIYSDILMGLNDSVSDPLVIELLRKRMAIQMAVMSMITSPIPADDPPRLVLYHVSEIAYASIGGGGLKKDDTKVVGLSPHPFLYIGSQESAKPKHLKSHAITHVIRLGNCRWPYQSCAGVSFHDLPIDDVPTARISSLFPTTTALLDGIRIRGERVLVHCQAGVSRSASIVLSFILRRGVKGAAGGLPNTKSRTMQQPAVPSSEQGLPSFSQASNSLVSASTTLREAFQILHSARPIVCPNPGFWSELEQYERVLCMAASSGLPGGSAFGNPAAMQTQSSSLSYFWMIQFHTVLDIEYRARAAVQRQSKAIQHG